MNTPRYIAKMVNGDYELCRADATHQIHRSILAVIGAGLAIGGLSRGSAAGGAMVGIGAGLIYAGVTGKNPLSLLKSLGGNVGSREQLGPSHQSGRKVQRMQGAQDEVEEASMASFPASDPPAHRATTATT